MILSANIAFCRVGGHCRAKRRGSSKGVTLTLTLTFKNLVTVTPLTQWTFEAFVGPFLMVYTSCSSIRITLTQI